jgi:DNA cross-link repair 1C protein
LLLGRRSQAQILLRIERYPSRMNFAKGILETSKQTYRHLKQMLKCLPLETPTVIELSPGKEIRVTLFDANHCIGAVMFLIEGQGKSILYTGDIRAESWLIDTLKQNPVLIPYAAGIKTLDTIYLDTTFATRNERHREFPSKADGIKELLEKIQQYPKSTNFFFVSWTFGYENVWMALSSFLSTRIHMDHYRYGLYRSIAAQGGAVFPKEFAQLCGYTLGNHEKSGCLSEDYDVRIHSCERRSGCEYMDARGRNEAVVIIPIITRINGAEVREIGAGGGKGDMDLAQEVELPNVEAMNHLISLCRKRIKDETTLQRVTEYIHSSYRSLGQRMAIDKHLQDDITDTKIEKVIDELVEISGTKPEVSSKEPIQSPISLPKTIRFPYSRHSSYLELCELVAAFKPQDVYPCTVDEENWHQEVSMEYLFGHLCSGTIFQHDEEMRAAKYAPSFTTSFEYRSTTESQSHLSISQPDLPVETQNEGVEETATNLEPNSKLKNKSIMSDARDSQTRKRPLEKDISPPPLRKKSLNEWAYDAALGLDPNCADWREFGGLTSVKNESQISTELEAEDL